jgi:hypothetical protein
LHLPRFRLRALLIAVAFAAALLAVGVCMKRRSAAFAERARHHAQYAYGSTLPIYYSYHRDLAAKYERAARYPWLPVEPDPPEPE